MGFVLALFLVFNQADASPYFDALRDDQSIPKKCKDLKLKHFQWPAEKFFVGRKGALDMGFTFEYPLKRSHATTLWKYFRSHASGSSDANLLKTINSSPDLKRDYKIILANYEKQDFDFKSEGEVLEVLAIHQLYSEFPENLYFITGGVEYHEEFSPMTIGELDIYVGRVDTCELVAVGEVKLGSRKTLNKARKQLNRFENFLIDHNAPGFSGVYQPGEKRDFYDDQDAA